MIHFVKKAVRKVEIEAYLNIVDKISYMRTESGYKVELIMLYQNGKYYGYVETDCFSRRMTPDCQPDFKPEELKFDENVIHRAYHLFDSCWNLEWIPVRVKGEMHETAVFLHRATDGQAKRNRLGIIKEYEDSVYELEEWRDKVICLQGLDEITWRLYYILKKRNIKICVSGDEWKWSDISSDKEVVDVPDQNVVHLSSDNLNEFISLTLANNKRNIQKAKEIYTGKEILCYTVSVPSYQKLDRFDGWERFRQNIDYTYLLRLYLDLGADGLCDVEKYILQKYCNMNLETILDNKSMLEDDLWKERPRVIGTEDATVYLVGPCIVTGRMCCEKDSLAMLLYERLKNRSLSYKVQRVAVPIMSAGTSKAIRELDIKDNDVVFIFGVDLEQADIDLLPLYRQRSAEKWWFSNHPIHTLHEGNDNIANRLSLFLSHQDVSIAHTYLQVGLPQISLDERAEISAYIKKVKAPLREKGKKIGAIIMNANPFTLGHQYLIEQASAMADYIYVFVVQEDASEFPFLDRIKIVRMGTQHLSNISVVPSGTFILSKRTMQAYFEKEELQGETVDVSRDVSIFGGYIALELGITVRFVGEEPFDSVTKQYNEEMKRKLPYFGIEVREIPRYRSGESIISATMVRKLYGERRWEEIEKYVPSVTLSYLRSEPHMRSKNEKNISKRKCQRWSGLLCENEFIILYGTGNDGHGVYDLFKEEEKEKVIFCDSKARKHDYLFHGKTVVKPEKLLEERCSGWPILITSTRYGVEIKRQLLEMGIKEERIYQNKTTYEFISSRIV